MIAIIVDDLMFRSKLSVTAKAKQTLAQFFSGSVEQNFEKIRLHQPIKIIIDLNAVKFDPIKLLQKLKSSPETSTIPIIGFVSHVQTNIYSAAKEAGCDFVMPRSKFVQELESLL